MHYHRLGSGHRKAKKALSPILKLQVSCRGPSVICDMVRSTAEESALISLEFMFLELCSSITIISLKIKLDSD